MQAATTPERDPLIWCAAIALAFLGLVWHRLGIPSQIYFDEIHYVPAARKLLQWEMVNPEHPMLGKEILAAAIGVLGDTPLNWRIPSALFGTFGLFAFGRLIWHASHRRFATLAGMLLLATSFAWFIQSRIAMLDMFMASMGVCGLWQVAVALRRPAPRARWHLLAAGVLFGLSMGAKWSVAPAVALPGLVMLALRFRDHGRRLLIESGTRPLPGISLWEAGLWLGAVPLAVYWATYMPGFLMPKNPIDPLRPLAWHANMIRLQDSVTALHTYRSIWPDWVVNWRSVWYLYQNVDGAQRGIVLIGNPFSMLAALPALVWCLWAGLLRRRNDALAFAGLYLALMSLWVLTAKPIQFYYHYLLPGTMLMGCLALALDDVWNRGGRWRWAALGALAIAVGMFAWFYPIISAGMLHHGRPSFEEWMWLASWR